MAIKKVKSIIRVKCAEPTGCFMPIGVYKKLATLNPENLPVNVISIDI
jgi:hypothetical protein